MEFHRATAITAEAAAADQFTKGQQDIEKDNCDQIAKVYVAGTLGTIASHWSLFFCFLFTKKHFDYFSGVWWWFFAESLT